VSGSVLLVAWVALLAGAVFWRPASTLDRPGWLAARCRTGAPTGLALTAAVLTLATSAWSLALVTFSVVHHTGLARHDPRGPDVCHRLPAADASAGLCEEAGGGVAGRNCFRTMRG
jgi:hypothetical protein